MATEMWLRCRIGSGQFSGEYTVSGSDFRGEEFSLFAPEESVDFDGDPSLREIDGLVQVSILQEENDLALVALPRPALANGQFVTVRRAELVGRRARQEA